VRPFTAAKKGDLTDRLAALDAPLRVEGPADGGTLVAADIPTLSVPQAETQQLHSLLQHPRMREGDHLTEDADAS
jgi:hypothetical protein